MKLSDFTINIPSNSAVFTRAPTTSCWALKSWCYTASRRSNCLRWVAWDELKWELARMCLETNWEAKTESGFGEGSRVNVNSNNTNSVWIIWNASTQTCVCVCVCVCVNESSQTEFFDRRKNLTLDSFKVTIQDLITSRVRVCVCVCVCVIMLKCGNGDTFCHGNQHRSSFVYAASCLYVWLSADRFCRHVGITIKRDVVLKMYGCVVKIKDGWGHFYSEW